MARTANFPGITRTNNLLKDHSSCTKSGFWSLQAVCNCSAKELIWYSGIEKLRLKSRPVSLDASSWGN